MLLAVLLAWSTAAAQFPAPLEPGRQDQAAIVTGLIGRTARPATIWSAYDAVVMGTAPAGQPLVFTGRLAFCDQRAGAPPHAGCWYEVKVLEQTGWIVGEELEADGHYDSAYVTDPHQSPHGYVYTHSETFPAQAFTAETTICYEDAALKKPATKLPKGTVLSILQRAHILKGEDVYQGNCKGRNLFLSGKTVVVGGTRVLHEFSSKQRVIVNGAGLGNESLRDYRAWYVNEAGENLDVAPLDCAWEPPDFAMSPKRRWLWMCKAFHTPEGRQHCRPLTPDLWAPAWVDEESVLLGSVQDGSVHHVEVSGCRSTQVIAPPANLPPQCADGGCGISGKAVDIDRDAGIVRYEVVYNYDDYEEPVIFKSSASLSAILPRHPGK